MNKTRVVIIDDHSIFRSGVTQALSGAGDILIDAEGASAAEALALCERHAPQVALLDLSMPGNGLEAAAALRERAPDTKVVILTVSEDEETLIEALDAGVAGYALKGVSASELAEVIRTVMRGETYLPPSMAARLVKSLRSISPELEKLNSLSARERLVLRLIAQGFTNKEVAEATGGTIKTVKFHVSNILEKLAVRNRTEAAIFFQKNGQ
jgi:two-component system nitrate/nitrite response regulator NarL